MFFFRSFWKSLKIHSVGITVKCQNILRKDIGKVVGVKNIYIHLFLFCNVHSISVPELALAKHMAPILTVVAVVTLSHCVAAECSRHSRGLQLDSWRHSRLLWLQTQLGRTVRSRCKNSLVPGRWGGMLGISGSLLVRFISTAANPSALFLNWNTHDCLQHRLHCWNGSDNDSVTGRMTYQERDVLALSADSLEQLMLESDFSLRGDWTCPRMNQYSRVTSKFTSWILSPLTCWKWRIWWNLILLAQWIQWIVLPL